MAHATSRRTVLEALFAGAALSAAPAPPGSIRPPGAAQSTGTVPALRASRRPTVPGSVR
ncbi:hypothetical protein [Streptomyces sp. NBC_01618]|uniref:hypothetical protein n=1 Tax=Streptomyces sp. NBC_01618 TaxID=2975900 RepID=UPI0038699788|nr:hypothetical protein OH735_30260 [Streptomyces sp. NBC_01618]